MALFQKRTTVFREKDREQWLRCRQVLRDAGIQGMRAGSFDEEIPVGGCGAKLDLRDFGPKGKIDRNTYYIDVLTDDADRAAALLQDLLPPVRPAPPKRPLP